MEGSTGSSLCLAPPWVVSSGSLFTTGRLFVPDSTISLIRMLLGGWDPCYCYQFEGLLGGGVVGVIMVGVGCGSCE